MTRLCYYENSQNNKIILQRKLSIPFSHIWRVNNLESLRYLIKTNIELPDYATLYTKVFAFLNHLRTHYKVRHWVVTPKRGKFSRGEKTNKFNSKRKRILNYLVFKISNTNTGTIYTILEFQKQITFNSKLMGISQRSSRYNHLFFDNLNYNSFLKSQINNEKI